jgi:hypothetical protein
MYRRLPPLEHQKTVVRASSDVPHPRLRPPNGHVRNSIAIVVRGHDHIAFNTPPKSGKSALPGASLHVPRPGRRPKKSEIRLAILVEVGSYGKRNCPEPEDQSRCQKQACHKNHVGKSLLCPNCNEVVQNYGRPSALHFAFPNVVFSLTKLTMSPAFL